MHMAEHDEVGTIDSDSNCKDEMVKKSPSKNSNGAIGYLTPKARLAFTKLRKAFTKAPILQHFDPKCYIRIKTDALSYAINRILSQLTLNNLGQWHPIAFYSQKMISAKSQYEIQNGELLAIVEAFKTWRHYLKDCRHKVLVLTNHNNLCRFIDTKSLSSRQMRWAQKLFKYYFWIDYCQGKANEAADALSCFFQRNEDKEKKLWAENTQILHCL